MLLVGSAMMLLASQQVSHEAEEVFDAALVQSTLVVQSLLPDELEQEEYEEGKSILFEIQEHYSSKLLSQDSGGQPLNRFFKNAIVIVIQSEAGQALLSSQPQKQPLPPAVAGFSLQQLNGESWKVFSVFDPKRKLWISSSHRQETRLELIKEVALSILPVFILGTIIICLALFYIVKKGLLPLNKISNNLKARHSNDLTAITLDEFPIELKATLSSLNNMFAKVNFAVQREQGFTDDAAHQLRTPLAAMLVHLDTLPEGDARSSLHHSVINMSHLVNQLLQLARLSPKSLNNIALESVDLDNLCAQVMAKSHPKAQNKQMALSLIGELNIDIWASKYLIGAMLENILDNAIQYSITGDNIQVIIEKTSNHCCILVVDHGPGLSEAEKEQVWERFFRVNHNTANGSGLGLSIVREIVALHSGECELLNTVNGGLTVKILLPLSAFKQ